MFTYFPTLEKIYENFPNIKNCREGSRFRTDGEKNLCGWGVERGIGLFVFKCSVSQLQSEMFIPPSVYAGPLFVYIVWYTHVNFHLFNKLEAYLHCWCTLLLKYQ